MTQLKRLAQVLPKYRQALYEHNCRTKVTPRLQPRLRLWLGRPDALRGPSPSTSVIQSTSSSARARTLSTHVRGSGLDQTQKEIIFSANQPADLPDRVTNLFPAWQLTASKKGIMRQFNFGSFTKAWNFMSLVAEECKAQKHHPSWSNLYDQVIIEWTTHKPNGLSIKDVEMAEFCDRTADKIGLKK